MALSNYLENQLIDFLFRDGGFEVPPVLYVALCSNVPSASDDARTIPEINGNGYNRRAIDTSIVNWYSTQGDLSEISTGTTGITGNSVMLDWGYVSWVGTISAVAVCDQQSYGNLLYFTPITPIQISIGDRVTLPVNTLKFRFG